MNKNNVVSLLDAVKNDFTGSGLTDVEKQNISNSLSTLKISNAKVTYDTKDPLYSDMSADIEIAGVQKMTITASRNQDKVAFVGTLKNDTKEIGKFTFESNTSGKNTDLTAKVTADMGDGSQSSLFDLTGKIEDGIIKNLTANLAAIIATGKLEYTHHDKLALTASF